MSSSSAYDVASSDDELPEARSPTFCIGACKHHRGYPVKRKVLNPTGRLGSLYENTTHQLIDRYSAQSSETKIPSKSFTCKIFSGHQLRDIDDVLETIGFNQSMLRSIRRQIIAPSGIARLALNRLSINPNTRILYYAYKDRREKISVDARKAHHIVPPPPSPTDANCMITKIVWGLEFLYVIQIPAKHPVQPVDELLRFIQRRLKGNAIPIRFDDEARQLFNRLSNPISYGTETCIDHIHVPIVDVLNQIPTWQRNTNFHQPLFYVTQPLRWLYNNLQFPESCVEVENNDSHIVQANRTLKRIENQIRDIDGLLYNFPPKFSSAILNQRLKEFRRHFQLLHDTNEDLQAHYEKLIQDIRRRHVKPTALNQMMTDLRYQPLLEDQMREFHNNVQRLADKAHLIEQLNHDRIEYINAFDVGAQGRTPMTNEAIDAQIKRSFAKENGRIILWYSGDRLRREQSKKWNEIYKQLIDERQKATQRIRLVYIDFTQCQQRLENFVLLRLPDIRESDFIDGKQSEYLRCRVLTVSS